MATLLAMMALGLAPASAPTAADHYLRGYVNSAVMDARGAVGLGGGMFRTSAGAIQPPSLTRDGGDAYLYIRDLGDGKFCVNFWMDAGAFLVWFQTFKGQLQISYTDARYGDQLITFYPVMVQAGAEWTWQSPVLAARPTSHVAASIWGAGMAVGGAYFVDVLATSGVVP